MNGKKLKSNISNPGGCVFSNKFDTLAHKIFILKSNFKLVGPKLVRCFIALQNFKKFGQV